MDEELRLQLEADISKFSGPVEDAIGILNQMRAGVIDVDEGLDRLEGGLGKTARDLAKLGEGAGQARTEFGKLWQEIREGQKELRKGLKSEVIENTGGSIGWGGGPMDLQQARDILSAYEARGKTAQQAAREVVSAADKEIDARARVAAQVAADKSAQISSRSYSNLSTEIDGAIEARKRESEQFSASLQARMRETSATERATTSTQQFDKSTKQSTQNLSTQRYALYDVASSYGAVSAALLAASTLAIKTGADFESAFTSVQRTIETSATASQIDGIRDSLVEMSTRIPRSFEEITQVATLGNQLGIAAQDLEGFTETVIKASTAFGVSIEETALAFGRIGDLLNVAPEQYEALGSSIALVGVNSVATESQILSLLREISATAGGAGFAANEVVGLSGALASLGVAPERARGSLDTYFATLNRAVANGGDELANFAQVVGVTASELEDMVRTGQGEDIFRGFLEGLADLDNVDTTRALDALNLAQLRVSNTFQRLSQNLDRYDSSQADAAKGWTEQAELARQFDMIVDDLSSQFIMLVNAVNALVEELTGGMVPGIAGVLGGLTDFVNLLRELASSDAVQTMAQFALVIGTVVGVLAALRAGAALATASTIALAQAQAAAGGTGFLRSLGLMVSAMFGYTKVTQGAIVTTWTLRGALLALGRALVIGAVLVALTELVFNFSGSMQWLSGVISTLVGGVSNFLNSLSVAAGTMAQAYRVVGPLSDAFARLAAVFGISAAAGRASAGAFSKWADGLDKGSKGSKDASNATAALNSALAGMNDRLPTSIDNMKGLGDSAKNTAQEVRTVADYANDLGGVFGRAFEIQFGPQTAMDSITLKWIELNEAMREHQATLASLTADRKIAEYFLGVAEAYGDQLRAGELRADLLKIDNDLADAQANVSKETVGNSKAAAQNRGTLQGLVKQYQDYITALAASGADQDTLNRAVAQSEIEFREQARQLGFSDQALQPYLGSLREMTKVINSIPRNITVNVSGLSAAEAAIAEFAARTRASLAGGINVPITTTFDGSGSAKSGRAAQLEAQLASWRLTYERAIRSGADNQAVRALDNINRIAAILNSGSYASGGYTGDGGMYQPAGVVHKGEFVFSKKATANLGVGQLSAMHAAAKSGRGYAGGGAVAPRVSAPSMPNVFVLDQAQYQGLVESGRVVVQIGQDQIANATNAANQQYANLGRG